MTYNVSAVRDTSSSFTIEHRAVSKIQWLHSVFIQSLYGFSFADVPGVIITVIKYLAVCFAVDNRDRCTCFLVLHSNMLMKKRWEMGRFINTVLASLLYFLCQFKLAQSVWQMGTMSSTCCDYLSAVVLLRHSEFTWCTWWKKLDFLSLCWMSQILHL